MEQVFPKPNINIILNKSPLSYEEYLIESDEFEFNGLYDINLQLQEIEVNESKIIHLGCEVEFPAPYDFKMVEEVEIELLEIVPAEEEKIGKISTINQIIWSANFCKIRALVYKSKTSSSILSNEKR